MTHTNPKRPEIKSFRKLTETQTRHKRQMIALDLLPGVNEKLKDKLVPDQIRKEMAFQISKFKKRKPKFTWRCLFKLYVVSDYPTQELQHWIMSAGQVYRKKNAHVNKATTHARRPSVYDPHGNLIPRSFIDKHLPDWVETQREYDRYMLDRRKEKIVETQKYFKKSNIRKKQIEEFKKHRENKKQ